MTSGPLCRELTREDADQICTLHSQGFKPHWPAADMAEHIDRDIVIGIDVPLSGFLIIRPAQDQAELLTITIAPNKRGLGLAKTLLRAGEIKSAEQGIEIIFLEVAEDNMAALALYKSLGYRPIGRRPAYYKRKAGRVAALTFRKTLDALPAGV